ncbi:hypothetical protein C8R45DRAFT_937373 [Mycena sanguinolenta]|nr:hypothetical protein C8R45DRAFT_937373 [Mycena sanguinolenta]
MHLLRDSTTTPWQSTEELEADTLVRNIQVAEGRILILVEFLEDCGSDILPYNVAETLERVTNELPFPAGHPKVDDPHQICLANTVQHRFAETQKVDILQALVDDTSWYWWLDNSGARNKVKNALQEYEQTLMMDPEPSGETLEHVQLLLSEEDDFEVGDLQAGVGTDEADEAWSADGDVELLADRSAGHSDPVMAE